MDNKVALKKINSLIKRFGLKSTSKNQPNEFYNKTIRATNSDPDLTKAEILVHNLSHYMCASPSRRDLNNFGLGESPSCSEDSDCIVKENVAMREENLATELDALIFADLKGFKYTEDMFSEFRIHRMNTLKSWGLIDSNFKPTYKLREVEDSLEDLSKTVATTEN